MKVENGDEFSVMRNLNNNEKVPLINPQTCEMVPDARIIFESWFDKFARPREEFDDAETLSDAKYMDKSSCVKFLISTIKDQRLNNYSASPESVRIDENSSTIQSLYKDYDEDKDDRLTKAEFLRFYQTKCRDNPNIVWQNLEKHNVGKDLMLGQHSDFDLTYNNDSCLVTDQTELPRYFISANQDLFNALFNLEHLLAREAPSHKQASMESVWRLIGELKTNPQLYLSILKNEDLEARLGNPRQLSSYRLLYTLQIMYSLMANYRVQEASCVNLYVESRAKPQLWN